MIIYKINSIILKRKEVSFMLLERFLKYVKIDTMSSEDTNTTPSTPKQFDLAKVLVDELKELGLSDIKLTDDCIVTATLPSNTKEKTNTIGFIAHLDTIPGFSGTNVKPQVHTNYNGGIITLKNNVSLNPTQFPFLSNLVGKTLITTDGTTVLGADDKAGIAIIMNMLDYFVNNPSIPHCNIKVAFTPDEEIGGGLGNFDVKGFGADFAYTIDGGAYDEINYENFNAASAVVKINGLDIHPGSAKGQMINAVSIACEFEMMLDEFAKPMYTEGYEGFNHLCEMSGTVTSATMYYILRNHDKDKLKEQKESFKNITYKLNNKYGKNVVELIIKDSYSNMKELIDKDPRSVEYAINAMKKLGINPKTEPIRGGTDGAKLTLMGLNTPNLGTGGYNCHGPYEFACLEEMEIVTKILEEIAKA